MSGVSKEWVLNQLAGMRFPGQGEAHAYMQKMFASEPVTYGRSAEIGPAIQAVFDKYPTNLSQAFIQSLVCNTLEVLPGEVLQTNYEVKKYLRANEGILFGTELVQPDLEYEYRERRFWRLPSPNS